MLSKKTKRIPQSSTLLIDYEKYSKRVPTREIFRETIDRLLIRKDLNALIAVKLQCLMGLRRVEVAHAKICNIDKFNRRSLFIDVTKSTKLKDEKKPQMKSREQPIPRPFYLELTEFVRDSDRTYILKRKNKGYSDDQPFTTRHISYFYERNQIEWSTHSSRRYYAVCLIDHMRKTKFIQKPLLRSLLGHSPIDDTTDLYINPISFEYKRSFIDNVEFYQDIDYKEGNFFENMQEAVKNGVIKAMEKPTKEWQACCPFCSAEISAPDFVKRVECPKCHRLLNVIMLP